MANFTLPLPIDLYKKSLQDLFKQRGINPDSFEGYRIDSGPDPFAPKPIPLENLSQVIKLTSPSANMPVEKFSDFGTRRGIDKAFVSYVKKHYSKNNH